MAPYQTVDTSMYPKAMSTEELQKQAQSQDPVYQAVQGMKLRNALGNMNKMRGGMPNTQAALATLGAGAPYPTQPGESQ